MNPLDRTPPIPSLIGESDAMAEVYRLTRMAAQSDASVLLLGETGTGKELIASALHRLSPRSTGPFIKVNCGALSETLLESELFGHVRGSFTDAFKDRTGRFEAAHTGTIFLDEINSTSTMLQVKLLRVLQEREFERVGDTNTIKVNVRVIAASNCDLTKEINEGRFREDLFWRLNVIPIFLPPLRNRREDIRPLAEHFLRVYNEQRQRNVQSIHRDALRALEKFHWPGNVRELQNYIERAIVLCPDEQVTIELLPQAVTGIRDEADTVFKSSDPVSMIREIVTAGINAAEEDESELHKKVVDPFEKELISQVMHLCNNVQTKAATKLGINRNTLYKKLKHHGLEPAQE